MRRGTIGRGTGFCYNPFVMRAMTRNHALLSVGLVVLLGAPGSGAGEPADVARVKRRVKKSGGYYTVKHGKYVIKTDVDDQFTAEAAVYMGEFYDAFRSFFKPKPKLKAVPTVYFFKDRASYQAHVRTLGKETLLKAGGFYSGSSRKSELFSWHNRPGAGFSAYPKYVVRHEGAHQLLSHILGTHSIPIWYNEGVATFFESWYVEKPREWNLKNLERTHTRFALIRRTFGTDAFKGLRYLMGLTHRTWVPDDFGKKTEQHYAEVQSFMTFLLVSRKGRKFFSKIFVAVAKRQDPAKMLSRKIIRSAQEAWYRDIQERIDGRPEPASKTAPVPSKRPAGRAERE